MMYIDDFNEMTGTKYTKESFIKIFSQYFPNGTKMDEQKYNENYKKMFDHALRFSIRSFVFKNDEIDYDVEKVARGLNTLFDEEISDYNKLMEAKGKSSQKVKFVSNAGYSKEDIDKKIISCVDDIPKTQQEEEYKMLSQSLKMGENLNNDEIFKKASMDRLTVLNSPNNGLDKKEQYSRSVDVIKNMSDRLNNKDKNYKFSHPLKYQEEKKNIDQAINFLEGKGYSKEDIEKDMLKPSKAGKVFSFIENNIKNGQTVKTTEDDMVSEFHKKLGNITSLGQEKERIEKPLAPKAPELNKGLNK